MGSSVAAFANPLPKLVQTISIPCFQDSPLGPLHSIIEDSFGNIYCSDEFNHRVISVKSDGSARWYKAGKGTKPGEFHYPRGLSLGYIQLNRRKIACLAVADGWNQRVQFLDIEGNQLGIWAHGGDCEFGEIADVRFVNEYTELDLCKEHAGFWYILDRGNSCLVKMGVDGTMLGRLGRFFPSNMNARWAAPAAYFSCGESASDAAVEFSPLDLSFFPERILGHSEKSLFLIEAGSLHLKQVFPPHLIPLRLNYPKNLRWIAADTSGLLAWDRDTRRLTRLTRTHVICDQVGVINDPIPSNLPLEYIWLQRGEYLEKYRWDLPEERLVDDYSGKAPSSEISTADKVGRFDLAQVCISVQKCLALLDDEIRLGDSILAMSYEGIPDGYMDEMSKHAIEFTTKCTWFGNEVHEALHRWSLWHLQRNMACLQVNMDIEELTYLEESRKDFKNQIASRIVEIQKRLDALYARISSLSGNSDPIQKTWNFIAEISKSNLEHAKGWIASWSGLNYSTLH